MKKFLIAAAIVVIFAAYAIYQHSQNTNKNNSLALDTGISQTPASDTPPTSAPVESTNPDSLATSSPTAPASSSGLYKDGTYTGTVADAVYGKLQVQAVIEGGKITDVKFLQYPNDRGETTEVSNRALPLLKSEAIAAQSARVDVVSGATQDSEAFVQTMQSALSQAM